MATKNKQTITVKSNEENPEPLELIAQSIIQVSEAFAKINSSRLKQRVVVLLIRDMNASLKISDIEAVLNAVPKLKDHYIKQVVKK